MVHISIHIRLQGHNRITRAIIGFNPANTGIRYISFDFISHATIKTELSSPNLPIKRKNKTAKAGNHIYLKKYN